MPDGLPLARFAYIADAVVGSNLSSLHRLALCGDVIGDEEGANHVKAMIAALPNLEVLRFFPDGVEDDAARELGEAIALHTLLEELTTVIPCPWVSKGKVHSDRAQSEDNESLTDD
ncbi:hypothetical protein Mapa_010261 [Marchantia paleacea]|nr:hypothetical protein Mapa_010261 [Marchantia paleacea]